MLSIYINLFVPMENDNKSNKRSRAGGPTGPRAGLLMAALSPLRMRLGPLCLRGSAVDGRVDDHTHGYGAPR